MMTLEEEILEYPMNRFRIARSHQRYAEKTYGEVIENVNNYFESNGLLLPDVKIDLIDGGKNPENFGEYDSEEDKITIAFTRSELKHRKIKPLQLGSTIAHELSHAYRQRAFVPDGYRLYDLIADEAIAYTIDCSYEAEYLGLMPTLHRMLDDINVHSRLGDWVLSAKRNHGLESQDALLESTTSFSGERDPAPIGIYSAMVTLRQSMIKGLTLAEAMQTPSAELLQDNPILF